MDIKGMQEEIQRKRSEVAFLEKKLEDATKDMVFCSGCNTYFKPEQLMKGSYIEVVKGEIVYTDSGYGDDDEYADVTYLHNVTRCPKCGKEHAHDKIYVKEENRRCRTQYK